MSYFPQHLDENIKYSHEIYIPSHLEDVNNWKVFLSDNYGGCTAYKADGHWMDNGINHDGTKNGVLVREDVTVIRVITDSPESPFGEIVTEMKLLGETEVLYTTTELWVRFA